MLQEPILPTIFFLNVEQINLSLSYKYSTLTSKIGNLIKRSLIGSIHRALQQIEATSSQKVWATRVSTGKQGGEPTLGQ